MSEELTFAKYDRQTAKTAIYPERGALLWYPTLGGCGESGELLDKVLELLIHYSRASENVKKLWRDYQIGSAKHFSGTLAMVDEQTFQKLVALRDGTLAELGDVLWYVAAIAREFNLTIEDIAKLNIEKVAGRLERGTVTGSGDNR